MLEDNQFSIIEKIIIDAIQGTEPGWSRLVISCYMDENQSNFFNTYLIESDGVMVERSLPYSDNLDPFFRELRSVLGVQKGEFFSSCRLLVESTGQYDASYRYDELNWEAIFKNWDRSNFN